MPGVVVRLYAELNDFLQPGTERRDQTWNLPEGSTVRDILAGHGIPENQVDLVLVNGESAQLDEVPVDGDRIAVYPVFESVDITRTTRLIDRPLRIPRFVLDAHLGKLCSHLRMMGFDALWDATYADDMLKRLSRDEGRLLLSRDKILIASPDLTRAYCVRSTDPREQIVEVIRRFDLTGIVHPFSRCIPCNGPLVVVSKSTVVGMLQPQTIRVFEEFYQCSACKRVYWKGSHYQRMVQRVREILADVSESR